MNEFEFFYYNQDGKLIKYSGLIEKKELIEKFLVEIDILLDNRYINSHAQQWGEYEKMKWGKELEKI